MKLDTNIEGWGSIFKPWQRKVIKIVYEYPIGANTATIHGSFKRGEVSRASVINFLKTLDKEELVNSVTRTNKGGKQQVYTPKYPREDFEYYVLMRFYDFMQNNLTEEAL